MYANERNTLIASNPQTLVFLGNGGLPKVIMDILSNYLYALEPNKGLPLRIYFDGLLKDWEYYLPEWRKKFVTAEREKNKFDYSRVINFLLTKNLSELLINRDEHVLICSHPRSKEEVKLMMDILVKDFGRDVVVVPVLEEERDNKLLYALGGVPENLFISSQNSSGHGKKFSVSEIAIKPGNKIPKVVADKVIEALGQTLYWRKFRPQEETT